MSADVRIEGLVKRFGGTAVLRGIDLHIPAGQTVALIGPSGSGKSTLLRVLMTLERPDAGRVLVDGQSMWTGTRRGREREAGLTAQREVRAKIGMVFQHFNLFPHMTALQNVAYAPRHVLGLSPDDARERARGYLERVGLADRAHAYPAALSGGQRQRVGIARALAMQPRVMLFDEPTSALDPESVGGVLDIIRELSAQRAMTMLIVTHQMGFAEHGSDRTVFFEAGAVVEDAPSAELFARPREARTREFLQAVLGA